MAGATENNPGLLLLVTLNDTDWASSSGPGLMLLIRLTVCAPESSRTAGAPRTENVGRSLTGATVRVKVSVKVPPPERLTVTVIVASPDWLATGVIDKLRTVPAPLNTRFSSGTTT